MPYERNPANVDARMRATGIVVVVGADYAQIPETGKFEPGYAIETVKAINSAGYVPELTFRIPEDVLREAMADLRRIRDESPRDNPMLIGVGSVINPRELEAALEMGFDFVVAPDSGMGGYPGSGSYKEAIDFVRIARGANVWCAPAAFPGNFSYYLERSDGLEPDAIKIFPAYALGPKGLGDFLAPYARERHKGRAIMPTGKVDRETGPQYQEQILKRGFYPLLGMSSPLEGALKAGKPGDPGALAESLAEFRGAFQHYGGGKWLMRPLDFGITLSASYGAGGTLIIEAKPNDPDNKEAMPRYIGETSRKLHEARLRPEWREVAGSLPCAPSSGYFDGTVEYKFNPELLRRFPWVGTDLIPGVFGVEPPKRE